MSLFPSPRNSNRDRGPSFLAPVCVPRRIELLPARCLSRCLTGPWCDPNAKLLTLVLSVQARTRSFTVQPSDKLGEVSFSPLTLLLKDVVAPEISLLLPATIPCDWLYFTLIGTCCCCLLWYFSVNSLLAAVLLSVTTASCCFV